MKTKLFAVARGAVAIDLVVFVVRRHCLRRCRHFRCCHRSPCRRHRAIVVVIVVACRHRCRRHCRSLLRCCPSHRRRRYPRRLCCCHPSGAAAKLPPTREVYFRAVATAVVAALLPLSCRRRRAVPKLPPTSRCPAGPAAVLPFVGWLLHCCPPSDFIVTCRHATINALDAGCFRRRTHAAHHPDVAFQRLLLPLELRDVKSGHLLWQYWRQRPLAAATAIGAGNGNAFPFPILVLETCLPLPNTTGYPIFHPTGGDLVYSNILGGGMSYLILSVHSQVYMSVTKPRNLHYRYCPLQYRYGLQY